LELKALDENSYREIGLVWRKNSSRHAEFRLLGEAVRACAKPEFSKTTVSPEPY
jgi:LysR family hydrogen peroxide-inducible transcriptional activator